MKKAEAAGATFGARLKALRAAAGLSQQQLADAAALSGKAFVWQLEHGRREPGWGVLCRLADALGVGLDAFRG